MQKLARHVSFNTTRRYLDITLADEAAAVDRLPDIGAKAQEDTEAMQATGTDDFSVSVLTSTEAGTGRHSVSSRVTGQGTDGGASADQGEREKPLKIGGCNASSHAMSQGGTGKKGKPAVRLRRRHDQMIHPLPAGRFYAFPDDFVWGASTSSHQFEGMDVHSDWWRFERQPGRVRNFSNYPLFGQQHKSDH